MEMIMNTNAVKNSFGLLPEANDNTGVAHSAAEVFHNLGDAIYKARKINQLIASGMPIEKAYQVVYKSAA